MTTLNRAAAAADVSISVTPAFSSSLPYPIAFAIESERLLVRGGVGTGTLYVDRGQDGTTAVIHALGTTVSVGWSAGGGVSVDNGTDPPAAVTTLVAPGAVIAGDSATLGAMRPIGPFVAAFDAIGIDSAPGVLLTTLPAGTFVESIRVLLRERFDDANDVVVNLRYYLIDHSDWWNASKVNVGSPNNDAGGAAAEGLVLEAYPLADDSGGVEALFSPRAALLDGVSWELRVFVDGGPYAKGTMDIYVVIASLAS